MTLRLSSALLVSSALALASCTVNISDPAETEAMVFSAVASHSTRGIIATTNYPVDEPFMVEAVHSGKPFMSGEKVQYDSAQGIWKTEEDFMWPLNGTIVFYAASPILPQISISPEKGVEADWSITTDAEAETDLCFALAEEPCKSHTAVVPIVFSHALSQICFKARSQRHYSSSQTAGNLIQANVITIILDSVKIGGIISEGHFTQNPYWWETDSSKTADYTIYSDKEGQILRVDRYDNPILSHLKTMLLIPQTLPKSAYIEEWHHGTVRTSITDKSTGNIVKDTTYVIPKHERIPLAKYCEKWVPDYKFTFRIAVGLEENTVISTAVTDWTETKEIILGDE